MPQSALPKLERLPHPSPVADDVRAGLIADPGFGRVFTDHMVTIKYSEGQGWHSATLGPRGPLTLDPATAVLHYAQEILSIRNINAMYYPLCQLYLRPVARVSNGYFSGISEVVVIKIDAI